VAGCTRNNQSPVALGEMISTTGLHCPRRRKSIRHREDNECGEIHVSVTIASPRRRTRHDTSIEKLSLVFRGRDVAAVSGSKSLCQDRSTDEARRGQQSAIGISRSVLWFPQMWLLLRRHDDQQRGSLLLFGTS
jgi:hypothetical protein